MLHGSPPFLLEDVFIAFFVIWNSPLFGNSQIEREAVPTREAYTGEEIKTCVRLPILPVYNRGFGIVYLAWKHLYSPVSPAPVTSLHRLDVIQKNRSALAQKGQGDPTNFDSRRFKEGR